MHDIDAELADEVLEIDSRWNETGKRVTTLPVTLERTDVRVTQLVLAWLPVD